MLIGSSRRSRRGRRGCRSTSAIARSATNPPRTHRPASGLNGRSSADRRRLAPSRIAPAAVIHERLRLRRPEEAEHAERRVRLLHLGEPLLPGDPQRVEQREALHPVRADQDLHPGRRLGVARQLRDEHLASRERGVDRREVADQQREHRQAQDRLDEGEDVRGEVGRPDEPERGQRRPAHLERRSNPLTPNAWNIAVNAKIDMTSHTNGRTNSPIGRVQRHDAIAPLVGAEHARNPVEDPPHPDEHRSASTWAPRHAGARTCGARSRGRAAAARPRARTTGSR